MSRARYNQVCRERIATADEAKRAAKEAKAKEAKANGAKDKQGKRKVAEGKVTPAEQPIAADGARPPFAPLASASAAAAPAVPSVASAATASSGGAGSGGMGGPMAWAGWLAAGAVGAAAWMRSRAAEAEREADRALLDEQLEEDRARILERYTDIMDTDRSGEEMGTAAETPAAAVENKNGTPHKNGTPQA